MACDQIKGISIFEVFLKQKILHFSLRIHSCHVLTHNFNDFDPNLFASHTERIKPTANQLQNFNDQAGCFNDIDIQNQDISFIPCLSFGIKSIYEPLSMPQQQFLTKLPDQIAFEIDHTIRFVERSHQSCQNFLLICAHKHANIPRELFVQESGNID